VEWWTTISVKLPKGSSSTECPSRQIEDTEKVLLLFLRFGDVDVSGYVSLQRVTAGLFTHVVLFRHLQWLSR
jgi:hypothetical protein